MQVIQTKVIDAKKKANAEAGMHVAARILRELVNEQNWAGTTSQLAAALKRAESGSIAAPRLAIWLRQHEPRLWWDYGVCVRFTRTGRQRLVHLSRRDQLSANALSRCDS
jgi:hypothetical protein